jgi:hypothetical protein
MTVRETTTTAPLSLQAAFEAEHARLEAERRAREEAERRQQEADLAGAEQLFAALAGEATFLQSRGLAVDQRRYAVLIDHERFRITVYFETGVIAVTLSDKRSEPPGASVPRRQENVGSLPDALSVIAKFLVEEVR